MSTEGATADATGGTSAPPINGSAGVGDAAPGAGTPADPAASFLSSQFEPGEQAPQPNGEAPPARESAPDTGARERPEYVKEQFWDAEKGEIKVEELAKSYGSLEHLLGKEKVPVPVDENDEEGIERWINAVRPETPDAYQFERSESDLPQGMDYDTELEQSFRNRAHQLGLMPHQAKVLHDEYFKMQTERYEQYLKMRQETRNTLQHELERKHGKDFPAVARRSKTMMVKYADPGFVQFLDETGLGDDPRMVDMLDRMGRDLEGSSRLVGKPQAEGSPQDVQAAIASYREKHHKALFDAEHPNHRQAVQGMNALYEQLYGDAPA